MGTYSAAAAAPFKSSPLRAHRFGTGQSGTGPLARIHMVEALAAVF